MRARARLATLGLLGVLALAAAGCGKDQVAAPEPTAQLGPEVEAVFPPARAAHVPCETEIWVRFHEPLDPTTVDVHSVFLKLDTGRILVHLALLDSGRTIAIQPLEPLAVLRTHTVELTPSLKTASGASFAQTYFWQFKTSGVRRLAEPDPPDRTPFESPVSPLAWRGTDADAGTIRYAVFAGEDSAAVAVSTTPGALTSDALFLPTAPWALGHRIYWRVRVENLDSGDQDSGPVWSFQVAPPGAPIDSVLVRLSRYASWDTRLNAWNCSALTSSGFSIGMVQLDFGPIDSTLTVADAYFGCIGPDPNVPTQRNATMHAILRPWSLCAAGVTAPPPMSDAIASGEGDPSSRVRFASTLLAARVQAHVRHQLAPAQYALRSTSGMTYTAFEDGAGIRIYYYKR